MSTKPTEEQGTCVLTCDHEPASRTFWSTAPGAPLVLLACSLVVLSVSAAPTRETWVIQEFTVGRFNGAEPGGAWMAEVIRLDDGTYRMYYGTTLAGGLTAIRYAESRDGDRWTILGTALQGSSDPSDPEFSVSGPSILKLPNGRFRLYYQSAPRMQPGQSPRLHVRSAISSNGVTFTREGVRINITPYDASSPWRLAGHGTYFYASNRTVVAILSGEFATDLQGPSDLKMATSSDGLTFTNLTTLYTYWHDPIVIKANGGYRIYATYLLEQQGTAFSTDGIAWPSAMTPVSFVDARNKPLTEANAGVGDIGGVLWSSGALRLFTNYGNPSENIVYFEQRPGVTITAPNGGESWRRGAKQAIRWTYRGTPGPTVKIQLVKNNTVIATITAGASVGSSGVGSYKWTVPSTQATGTDYKVRITSTTNSACKDLSDNTFTIAP